MDELVIKIQIIPKPLDYWQNNDPVIPAGFAAYVTDNNTSTVRHGDGTKKWSQISDTHADMYVQNHAQKHAAAGNDPLIATDREYQDGELTTKVPTVKQVSDAFAIILSSVNPQLAKKAPLISPSFTGTPISPTAPVGTNTTQLATTAFVNTAISNAVTTAINNITLVAYQPTPPANTNLLWLNTADSTLNYYDDKLFKWVPIVGNVPDASIPEVSTT